MTLEHPARAFLIEHQARLLDFYGVTATSRCVELQDPPMKSHVLDAGKGEPLFRSWHALADSTIPRYHLKSRQSAVSSRQQSWTGADAGILPRQVQPLQGK